VDVMMSESELTGKTAIAAVLQGGGSRVSSIEDPESLCSAGSDSTLEMSLMTTIMLSVCASVRNF
jgi:hypothetical protein